MRGIVFNINRFTIHDGPGIRTTVFLYGCPLRCPWCHNPESWVPINEAEGLFAYRSLSLDGLFGEIERDVLFYDESGGGVTFSGGEPLSQPVFLEAALKKCRERRIHCAVDTCGVGGPNAVEILSYADLILFDIKGLNETALISETGARLTAVNNTLEGLVKMKKRLWLRLPLIPGFGVMNERLDDLKNWVQDRATWFERINLIPYHRIANRKHEKLGLHNQLHDCPEPDRVHVNDIAEALRTVHGEVKIGG